VILVLRVPPLDDWNVVQWFDTWADAWSERLAIVDGPSDTRLTYGALAIDSRRLAAALAQHGTGRGDRIVYWADDHPRLVALWYAANRIGAAWVPVNARLMPHEAAPLLAHADPTVLVVGTRQVSAALPLLSALRHVRLLITLADDDAPPFVGWLSLLRTGPLTGRALVDAAAPAGILYTSGTTGEPKGALHTHRTLLGWCLAVAHALAWGHDERILLPYPLFHMGGVGFTLAALALGATVVRPREVTPAELTASARDEGVTALVAPPTVFVRLLDAAPAADAWSTLRRLAATSAPLWPDTARRIRAAWPHATLTALYSATEAVFSFLPNVAKGLDARSVGRAALGMQLQIRGATGGPLGAGQPGLIWCRGISVFAGYFRSSAALPDADGWHTCRDIGYLDADGNLFIVDREPDIINSGGEKIASAEVEDVLLRHPAVSEAAVVGVPDPVWGERVHAVVVLKPGASADCNDLLAWCGERLSAFKRPKSLRIAEALPKSPVGKILKRLLRTEEAGGV
jgi:acyl-CoA synthetase (AMP-forming)/AMP-acid ligase II